MPKYDQSAAHSDTCSHELGRRRIKSPDNYLKAASGGRIFMIERNGTLGVDLLGQ